MITKESLGEIVSRGRQNNGIIKITFVASDDNKKLDAVNRKFAEKMFENYKNNLPCGDNFVVLLSPNITYVDEDIISIRYDFTITSDRVVVYHKRFCINMLLKQEISLLPRFVFGKIRLASSNSFYLKKGENGDVYAVKVVKSLERGMRINRGREIDDFCDSEAVRVKIKIPHCMGTMRNM